MFTPNGLIYSPAECGFDFETLAPAGGSRSTPVLSLSKIKVNRLAIGLATNGPGNIFDLEVSIYTPGVLNATLDIVLHTGGTQLSLGTGSFWWYTIDSGGGAAWYISAAPTGGTINIASLKILLAAPAISIRVTNNDATEDMDQTAVQVLAN